MSTRKIKLSNELVKKIKNSSEDTIVVLEVYETVFDKQHIPKIEFSESKKAELTPEEFLDYESMLERWKDDAPAEIFRAEEFAEDMAEDYDYNPCIEVEIY